MSELHKALVKAQSQLKNPAMDATNPHFRSKFASLKSVCEAVIPVFNKNGLAVIQRGVPVEGGIGINTVIIHEAGEEFDAGTISIPVGKSDCQAYMSAVTYARRYGIQTVAGVVGDPDDDGNGATKLESKPAPKKEKPKGKNFEFLKKMGELKKIVGEERYYQIIGSHGYEKSSEIESREHQIAVWKELDMVAKAVEEME